VRAPTSTDDIQRTRRLADAEAHFVLGSHTLWNDLLVAGLVDELHLMVGPALLGGGTPVFEASSRVPLRRLDARTLESSELVLVRYAAGD
jgi:dihydrofolate reductase